MSEFLALGGYGAFVWPAYGAAAGAMAVLAWRSLAGLARARRLMAALGTDDEPA